MIFVYNFFEWLYTEPKAAALVQVVPQRHTLPLLPLPERTHEKALAEDNARLRARIRLHNARLKKHGRKTGPY